jgi:hypothetical protein
MQIEHFGYVSVVGSVILKVLVVSELNETSYRKDVLRCSGTVPFILNIGTVGRRVVSFALRLLYSCGWTQW